MKRYILTGLVVCISLFTTNAASELEIKRIDPPNWWVGMKDSSLQLCIYAKGVSNWQPRINYAGVTIRKVNKVENPDYLFVDLTISPTTNPGNLNIYFNSGKSSVQFKYSLKKRVSADGRYKGFDSKDFIYMLMPDRFANGDTQNDIKKDARETLLSRDSIFERHGGDLQGVIDHLDYIKELGATTLWVTPFQENDQKFASYHGYAVTDHYKVDPRFGADSLYPQLVARAHTKGLKVIMDMVYNHVGDQHWFYKDPPMKDWIHRSDSFTQTNYRLTALMDPHASVSDKEKMSDGWFVRHMPDLNQNNPFLAKYLIQNAIWWIEGTGIDGYRLDTYAYSDLGFMNNLVKAIRNEYPHFGTVGEVWDHSVSFQAYLTENSNIKGAPESHLPGVTDFQLYFAINDALNKPMDWTGGLAKIYYTLAQDFLYADASRNLIFLDNHDLSRFYSVVGEDYRKFEMGIGFLLTTRGIPCLYYGTEILMKNFADPDGKVRADFPGGWKGDKENKFEDGGRTNTEKEAFNYVKKLANYRAANSALQTGKLTQFVPEKDVYVYFRSDKNATVMVVMYASEKKTTLSLDRYNEMLTGFTKGKDIMDGKEIDLKHPLDMEPYSIRIVELER